MSKYVYGIDLGTTYSCIAYQEGDRPTVLKNLDTNSDTTPSVVQWGEDGTVIVGQEAKDTSVLEESAGRTVSFVKRLIGKSQVATTIDGRQVSPVEVSAYILRELVRQAQQQTDDEVKDVVITCPAYFGDTERTATKQAGEMAGLNVLSIIEEPTAAAICYGVTKADSDRNVLIYDLGGGTFDITVLKITNGEIRVITTEGDHDLGGKNWDDALSTLMVDKFLDATGYTGDPFDEDGNEEFMQQLQIESEKTKQTLSNKTSVKKLLDYNGQRAKIEVTRDEFDDITSELLERTKDLTQKAIDEAKAQGVDIDEILLVGGSTMMPQVQTMVGDTFGVPFKIFEPHEAVAKGAAIYAIIQATKQSEVKSTEVREQDAEGNDVARDTTTGETRMLPTIGGGSTLPTNLNADTKVISVSTKSFGIKANDSQTGEPRIFNIVKKDDELPAHASQQFATVDANQEQVLIELFESPEKADDLPVDASSRIGDCEMNLPAGLPAHTPLEITLAVQEDGTISLHGQTLDNGTNIDTVFKSENVLSKKEIEEARKRVSTGLVF
ncbi:Hsp70 family protein [Bifidobacterium parmae]|uniref:2-alkenal reductase n=1 Tax=Bifidobacterium parmae TaxID=361854 RepID=A0A2N5IVT2_9BIFI|nr:Hsp70 family protein [Bifidobacterium parmae]PLS26066.1 2-alkenal reductase [Bifidobacterium parmae]